MCRPKSTVIAQLICFAVLIGLFCPASQGFGHLRSGEIEANFLVNIFRYVKWQKFEQHSATVCFLQPSSTLDRLKAGLESNEPWARLEDHHIEIRLLIGESAPSKDELAVATQTLLQSDGFAACQVLFLDPSTADKVWALLINSNKLPAGLLTFSTQTKFAANGGMFQIMFETEGYRYGVNPAQVRTAEFTVGPRLTAICDLIDSDRYRIH